MGIRNLKKIKRVDIIFWFVIILYRLSFYLSLIPYKVFADSDGYIHFPFKLFFLTPDAINGRTFVYPLIIRTAFMIFGEKYYLTAVVSLQIIASFIAVIYLKKIIEMFVDNRFLVGLIVGLYAVNSSIIGWDKAILTESLALSLLVISFYFIFMYLRTRNTKFAVLSLVWAFIAIFQRPSSLLYFLIISLFCFLYQIVKKTWDAKLNTTIVLLFGLLLGYCFFFWTKFEIFSISNAMPRQQLIVVMEKKYYKSSSNQEFVEMIDQKYIEKNGDTWAAMWEVLNYFGNAKVKDYTRECINLNRSNYILDRLNTMYFTTRDNYIDNYYEYKCSYIDSPLFCARLLLDQSFRIFNVGSAFVFIVLSGIVLTVLSFQRRRISWIALGMFGFSVGTVLVSFFGTCGEYARTMVCVLPIIYIGLGWGIGGFNELDERNMVRETKC